MKKIIAITLFSSVIALTHSSVYAQYAEKMHAQDILFSTSTLNDVLPAFDRKRAKSKLTIETHEDNWRQFELVSLNYKDAINRELANIDKIWKEKSAPLGEYTAFKEVHVRKDIPKPLSISFSNKDFEKMIGGTSVGFAFIGYKYEITDVYAIRKAGFIFYAHIVSNQLVTFGVEQESNEKLPKDTAKKMQMFIDNNKLVLIHWRSRTALHPSDNAYGYLADE